MKRYLRTSSIFFFSVSVALICSGCATIGSKRGVTLSNPSNVQEPKSGVWEYPHEKGNMRAVWIKDPPLTIQLKHYPEEDVLFFGPDLLLIPLPIIPWPPGIISRIKSPNYDDSQDKVEVVLTFARLWGYFSEKIKPADYQLDPKNVILKSGKYELKPSSSSYSVSQVELVPYANGGYTFGKSVPDPYGDRYGEHNGVYDIHVSSEYDRSTEIHLVFDISYRDIRDAQLEIKHIRTASGMTDIPPTLLTNGRRTKLFLYAINN